MLAQHGGDVDPQVTDILKDMFGKGQYNQVTTVLREAQAFWLEKQKKDAEDAFRFGMQGIPQQPVGQAVVRGRRPTPTLHEQLRVRLKVTDLDELGLSLHLVQKGEAVFVFGVKDDTGFALRDGADLFPSDQLVSQLRLIRG